MYCCNLGAGGKWSAPLHVTMTLGKAGALAGYEKVSTVMAATSTRLFDQLELGLIPTFGVGAFFCVRYL